MKLSNLYGIVLTFADDLFIGDIPINEETKYYGHILRDGDQIIFTFSDVSDNDLITHVHGVSARIYVKNLGEKRFKISGVLFNLRNAAVWDHGSNIYVDIKDEQQLKLRLAKSLANGTLQAGKPTKINNIFSYIKQKLNELVLEKIPSNDPEPSANDLKAREELKRKQESERITRANIRKKAEQNASMRKDRRYKSDLDEFMRKSGYLR